MGLIWIDDDPTAPAMEPPAGVAANAYDPSNALSVVNLVAQIAAITLVTPFVLLRVYAKASIAPPFLVEDWICVLAWFLAVAYNSTGIAMYMFGGGFHAWNVSRAVYERFLKALYANSLIYGPCTFFTKIIILLMFVRLFKTFKTTIVITWALMIAMLLFYIPMLALKIGICTPIYSFWDKDLPPHCMNQQAMYTADTIVSAVTGVAILLLPIPATLTLRVSKTQKLKAWAMLGIGGAAAGVSIARMILVLKMGKSSDITVTYVLFHILGTAEVSIGLITACLPAMNLLLRRYKTLNERRGGGRRNGEKDFETGDYDSEAASPQTPKMVDGGLLILPTPRTPRFHIPGLRRMGFGGRRDNNNTTPTTPSFPEANLPETPQTPSFQDDLRMARGIDDRIGKMTRAGDETKKKRPWRKGVSPMSISISAASQAYVPGAVAEVPRPPPTMVLTPSPRKFGVYLTGEEEEIDAM